MPHPDKEFTTNININAHFTVLTIRATAIHFEYNKNLTLEEQETLKNAPQKQITYSDVSIGTNYVYQEESLHVTVGIKVEVLLNGILLAVLKAEYAGDFICKNIELSGLSLTDFATQNAPAMVYPYLRQGVNFITTQAGFPALVLPVIMMKKVKI